MPVEDLAEAHTAARKGGPFALRAGLYAIASVAEVAAESGVSTALITGTLEATSKRLADRGGTYNKVHFVFNY